MLSLSLSFDQPHVLKENVIPHREHPEGFPSVTQLVGLIAKPALYYWYGAHGTEKCEQIKRESQEIGTAFHKAMSDYLTENTLPENELARRVVDEWCVKHDLKPVAIEDAAYVENKTLKYAGTPDFIGYVDDVPCVLDWKSSSQMDKTMALQLGLYAWAWNQMKRKPILTKGIVVRVDKKTHKVEVKEYEDLMSLRPILKGLICLYWFLHPPKKK